ncbi:MAG: hypothetical protein WCQ53_03770 [bacterium]
MMKVRGFLLLLFVASLNVYADPYDIKDLDLNSNDVKLSLMGEMEGRSIILKIKDTQDNKLGVFKPTSGSTLHRGEYAMSKLGEMVGLDLYPKAELKSLTPKTQKKVMALLEWVRFDKYSSRKEQNRQIMMEELKKNIDDDVALEGTFKPWYTNFQFYLPLGTVEGLKKHVVYKYMKASSVQPPHKRFLLKQCTQLLEPKGCTSGYTHIDDLAHDMSSIMLLDAVMGNNDRFPGGNVHFRIITGKDARLFSLDNGAVLKPKDKTALNILKDLGITRFVKQYVDRLYEIRNMDKKELRKDLGLSPEEFEIFLGNLTDTLQYLDEIKAKYGDKIWFK